MDIITICECMVCIICEKLQISFISYVQKSTYLSVGLLSQKDWFNFSLILFINTKNFCSKICFKDNIKISALRAFILNVIYLLQRSLILPRKLMAIINEEHYFDSYCLVLGPLNCVYLF